MFRIFAIFLFALAIVSTVSALVIPRKEPPPGWRSDILESYDIYHDRYLDLDCEKRHNTHFFQECCHPRLKSQEKEPFPKACTPSTPLPSLDEDCDDDDNDGSYVPPSTTLPSSSEVPSSPSTSTHTTPSPSLTNHADTSPTPVATPTPSQTKPSPDVHKQPQANPSPTTTTPSPSPVSAANGPVYSGGQATYFYQNGNRGACGQLHSDNDLVIALVMYDNGAHCGQSVKITDNKGQTAIGKVWDECPTCLTHHSIDLSVALFEKFAPLAEGVFPVTWEFV